MHENVRQSGLTPRNNFEDLFKISFVCEGAFVSFYKNSSSGYLDFVDSILMYEYNHRIHGEMLSIQCFSFSTTFFRKNICKCLFLKFDFMVRLFNGLANLSFG